MKKKLSGVEKFAYGIGAVGKDMVYMLSASYVLYYFQDIMGVSAIAMGIILFAARIFDAFNDPVMGVLVAKTKTKWGKFRPWLLIGTLFNAIVLYCMFACPPTLNGSGLVAYAAITYILWGVTYTMMDIPYWSMVPAFTESGKERENLSALARSCAGVGSAIISIVTVMAVAFFGSTAAAKSNDMVTYKIDESTHVAVTVMEKDADGVATGNIIELKDGKVSLEIKAVPSTFDTQVYLNKNASKENAKFDLKVGTVEVNNDNAFVTYAMDSIDDKEGVLALYLNEEDFAKVTGDTTVSGTISSTAEVERLGFKYFSLVVAVLFLVFILITCFFIKEKSTVNVETPSVGAMFKALVQNDQAMAVVITIVLINTATYITSNLVIYFFKYDLAGKNWRGDYTLFNTFGGGIQILAMMLFFPLLRKFFNNIKIFYVCVASAVVGYLVLLAMAIGGVGSVYAFLIPCFFIMAAVGILNVIVTIFLANTVDYGELKNGRRDESVIFSMQTFVVKLASGVAALIASICLAIFNISAESDTINGSVVDFVNTNISNVKNHVVETISNNSVIGLRLTMTIVPIAVLLVGIFVFKKRYILTDNKLEEITNKLNESRAE